MFKHSDFIQQFISDDDLFEMPERAEKGDKSEDKFYIRRAELYKLYSGWCDANSISKREVLTKSSFNDKIEELGHLNLKRHNGSWSWFGLRSRG